jgi:hypothetical protein
MSGRTSVENTFQQRFADLARQLDSTDDVSLQKIVAADSDESTDSFLFKISQRP